MLRSILSLGFLQLLNYIFPFISLLVISRTIGQDLIGLILFAQSMSCVLAILVEYGFHLSGVRLTTDSILEGNSNKIMSSIQAAKILLFIPVLLITIPLVWVSPAFGNYSHLYILLGITLMTFSIGFRPLWYFQSLNAYKTIILSESLASSVSLAIILLGYELKIRDELLLILFVLPRSISTIYLIMRINKNHGWIMPTLIDVYEILKNSFLLFLHKLFAGILHTATPIILSFSLQKTDLLTYQKAEKIFYILQTFLLVISQVGFSKKLQRKNNMIQNIFFYQVAASISVGLLSYFFAPLIFTIVWNDSSKEGIYLFRWFCIDFVLLGVNSAIGLTILLPRKKDFVLVTTALLGAISSLIYLIWFAPLHFVGLNGVIAISIGEGIILILMALYLIRSKIFTINGVKK
jgi:PST family polysaccharide transporter